MFGEKRGVLVELVVLYYYFCLLSCPAMNIRFIFYIILLCSHTKIDDDKIDHQEISTFTDEIVYVRMQRIKYNHY